jgi:hypothetical protein
MPPRLRRFVAAIALLLFLAAYVWAAVAIGDRLPEHPVIQLIYFAVAGLAWGLPLYPLFRWAEGGGRR